MESPETAFHSVLLQLILNIALCAALVPRVCVFERGRVKGCLPGTVSLSRIEVANLVYLVIIYR